MAVEIGPVISLIAQRIILAPSQIDPPSPMGRGTPQKRYREGLITPAQFRAEMATLGYTAPEIDRALAVASLEHEFDTWSDKLSAVQEAYSKEIISYEQMKSQVLQLVPDQPKALILVQLYEFRKHPTPKAVTPDKVPTLTVAQLLAAWKAGVLPEPQLRIELAERKYEPADISLLLATETAKLVKPTAAAQKQLTLAELKAMLAAGIISGAEFYAELIARNYTAEDASRLLGLEIIKIQAREAA